MAKARTMQAAMQRVLAELWAKKAPGSVVKTPLEALTLAAIVEKETLVEQLSSIEKLLDLQLGEK